MFFPHAGQYGPVLLAIAAAWIAGAIIGLERGFHGRPAGFRTHALVCVSSAVLMTAMNHQEDWLAAVPADWIRTDPARMAEGIMTGIGFLGAGVIFKEGLTVRGLTTAASIWTTAAIGILFGIGYFVPAVLTTIVAFGTLSVVRWLEARVPAQIHAQQIVRFLRDKVMAEDELRTFFTDRGFAIINLSYRLIDGGDIFEYRMVLRTLNDDRLTRLAADLRGLQGVVEFRLAPRGD
jgi:putative Mg2+ transporter-C (MgtC) family protein